MKKILRTFLVVLLIPALKTDAAPKIPPKALNTVVKVVTGLFAVKATGEAVVQADVIKEKDSILEALKALGLGYDDPAIYSKLLVN